MIKTKLTRKKTNRYAAIIADLFFSEIQKKERTGSLPSRRVEFEACAKKLRITLPKNLGDLVYSFRYRANLAGKNHVALAGEKEVWVICVGVIKSG